jgi:hypothetical protein
VEQHPGGVDDPARAEPGDAGSLAARCGLGIRPAGIIPGSLDGGASDLHQEGPWEAAVVERRGERIDRRGTGGHGFSYVKRRRLARLE